MPGYRNDLLRAIAEVVQPDELVLEIGSNDGAFLKLIENSGHRNLIGIEPSIALAEKSRQEGLRIETGYFDSNAVNVIRRKYGNVRLVVCRHTLEHIPNPGKFLVGIKELLTPAKGVLLIEVPDSSALKEGLNFVELWDEHLHYFTANTLSHILLRHGFSVTTAKTFPHLDTRNLLIMASIAERAEAGWPDSDIRVEDWRAFSTRFQWLSQKLVAEIKKLPRPVYLVGASHPQCNFVNYLDLGGNVDFMIDDDTEKVGKYPPVKVGDIGIITTDAFAGCSSAGAVVLTGFGYPDWNRRIADIANTKDMLVFDPHTCVE